MDTHKRVVYSYKYSNKNANNQNNLGLGKKTHSIDYKRAH